MTIGTVRWFDAPKGYRFIKPDDGGVDVMVDICALERAGMASLDQGQRLGFEDVRDDTIGRSCAENSAFSAIPRAGAGRCRTVSDVVLRVARFDSTQDVRTAIRYAYQWTDRRRSTRNGRCPSSLVARRKWVTNTQFDIQVVFLLSLGAFVVWLACGLTMAFGRPAFGLETTLRIHAIAAPVFAADVPSLVSFCDSSLRVVLLNRMKSQVKRPPQTWSCDCVNSEHHFKTERRTPGDHRQSATSRTTKTLSRPETPACKSR